MDRRRFLLQSTGALAGAALPWNLLSARQPDGTSPYKKAVKFGMIRAQGGVLEKFQLLKELGFDGVEIDGPSNLDLAEVRAAIETTGIPVHGVVDSVHWGKPLNHPDPAVRKAGLDGLLQALRDAKQVGATTVLLVPAVVNAEMGYRDAYQRSQEEVRKALPLAEELGIKIAFENVWNQFLLSPLEAARYIDEFESPWVGAYFDVGNVVNYGWPEHWIEALGKRILKVDVKEFSRKKRNDEGLWKGFQVELLEGDCNWPRVMQAFRAIGYEGFFTAEIAGGDRTRLQDIATRMDRIFAS